MSEAAFLLLALMLTMYVITDGYDLGAAAVSPLIARDERERAAIMQSIGPFWSGNEVWLIAAGGALFALFPQAYASAFSGFYLPFMVVLWLLMFRGIAMECRMHFSSRIWHDFWDVAFSVSSLLLIFLFGVTIGNLLRGLPLDANAYFTGSFAFLLNPYALSVGLLAVATLAHHGLLFIPLRIEGKPAQRARLLAERMRPCLFALYVAITIATLAVHPGGFDRSPFAALPLLIGIGTLLFIRFSSARNRTAAAFFGSCAFILSLLSAAAASMYPYLLPAYPVGTGGLTIYAASPSTTALATALTTTLIGLCLVALYTGVVVRRMRGKIVL